MLRKNFPKRKEQRKVDAEARSEAYRKLSVEAKRERNSTKVCKKLV